MAAFTHQRVACDDCRAKGREVQRRRSGKHAEYMKQWRANGGWRKQLDADLRRGFGITADDYERMLAEQGGVCALCFKDNVDGRRLAVDHDHTTGKVRGLLCSPCNRAIGFFGDDPRVMERAAIYVELHSLVEA